MLRRALVALCALAVAGCTEVTPITSPLPDQAQLPAVSTPPAKPQPTPPPAPRTATAHRGPIAEVLLLNGRVAGSEESPLAFSAKGIVDGVFVQPGQPVRRGQVLVQADARQIQKDLDTARSKVAQLESQSANRAVVAVADAEAKVRQAQADFDKVRAGPSPSERQAADSAVLTARSTLDKAEADYAKLAAGADDTTIQAATEQVTTAQLNLQSAQNALTRLQAGPDPVAVRAAEHDLTTARADQATAQAEYDRLTKGPDPFDVRAAQRAVDQAQANLTAAQNSTATGSAKDAAIQSAQLALQDAQDKLTKLTQPASQQAIDLARSKLDDAKAAVGIAQDHLDAVRLGADQLTLAKAQAAVDVARTAYDAANANLQLLQDGPTPEQLQTAQTAVEGARLALDSASARQAELNSHPTPNELRDASDRLAAAQATLTRAQNGDTSDDLNDAHKQVANLEQALDAAQLRAPVDGVVSQVLVQPGDSIDTGKPAVVLAQSSELFVRVNLLDADKPKRVAVDNPTSVQVDGADNQTFTGTVATFAEPASNGDRIALVKVDWRTAHPTVGTGARVGITVQQKSDALILPRSAVKSAGSRRYVEYMDGAQRKAITVQVGITTPTDVEILSGIDDGQVVLLSSTP